MTNYTVNLFNCDTEPIHIPGMIQSHGFLVAVDINDLSICYVSENILLFTGIKAASYLGKNLEELESNLLPDNLGLSFNFAHMLSHSRKGNDLNSINPYSLILNGKLFNLIITSSGNFQVLEFEPADTDVDFDGQKAIGRSISEILSGKNLATVLRNAAHEIKKLIEYDRVMIYRFNEDGHGEVIAEEKEAALEPFLGLHYPESDIPQQARELYKKNLTRIIADVNSEGCRILARQVTSNALDLTNSVLRAVSPIHIQYLKNMGVQSSFSISLLAKGALWGLIACHNYSPRFINYKVRDASKLIGQILSSALEYRQGEEDSEEFISMNDDANILINNIDSGSDIAEALTGEKITIKDITKATGAVLVLNGKCTSLGITPETLQVNDIIVWLKANMQKGIYHTHQFPEQFKPAEKYSDIASGLLACKLSRDLDELIIWFKPEQVKNVTWAGNPKKIAVNAADGSMQLTPRKSFEKWSEIVRYTSEKWNRSEVAAVVNIREQIIYAMKRKATEIKKLNEKLKIAYDELDTFSFTISHDLRTPLSSIKAYAEILLETNTNLDENAKTLLARINNCTDKMAFLIKEILNYSSIGSAPTNIKMVDMGAMINEIKREVLLALKPVNIEFSIGETPCISGDEAMITQAFTNLINNGGKIFFKV